MTEKKNQLVSQNTILTTSYKEKCARLDQRIKTLMTQNEELVNRVLESEKQQKVLHEDKEKLKQRIAKIAKRGGKMDN